MKTPKYSKFNPLTRWLNRVTSPEGCTAVDAIKVKEYNRSLGIEISNLKLDIVFLSQAIHYPECWDTMAYPTLLSALEEIGCNAKHED